MRFIAVAIRSLWDDVHADPAGQKVTLEPLQRASSKQTIAFLYEEYKRFDEIRFAHLAAIDNKVKDCFTISSIMSAAVGLIYSDLRLDLSWDWSCKLLQPVGLGVFLLSLCGTVFAGISALKLVSIGIVPKPHDHWPSTFRFPETDLKYRFAKAIAEDVARSEPLIDRKQRWTSRMLNGLFLQVSAFGFLALTLILI